MLKKARWYSMTEEEKTLYVFNRAMQKCQESYFQHLELFPETAKEFIQLQKDIMDWIAPKIGHVGLPLYDGEGICGTVQYLKQQDIGETCHGENDEPL